MLSCFQKNTLCVDQIKKKIKMLQIFNRRYSDINNNDNCWFVRWLIDVNTYQNS